MRTLGLVSCIALAIESMSPPGKMVSWGCPVQERQVSVAAKILFSRSMQTV